MAAGDTLGKVELLWVAFLLLSPHESLLPVHSNQKGAV